MVIFMVMAGKSIVMMVIVKFVQNFLSFSKIVLRGDIFLILVGFVVGIAKEKVPVDFNFRYRIRAECRRTIKGKSGGERKLYLHETFKFELLELLCVLITVFASVHTETLDYQNFYLHSRAAEQSRDIEFLTLVLFLFAILLAQEIILTLVWVLKWVLVCILV